MKEKVAITVTRYGKDINGGAELHCRMLAERLAPDYDVEILTTCIKDYVTGEAAMPKEWRRDGGVTVRRFATVPYDRAAEKKVALEGEAVTQDKEAPVLVRLPQVRCRTVSRVEMGARGRHQCGKVRHILFSEMIRYIEEHKEGYKAYSRLRPHTHRSS